MRVGVIVAASMIRSTFASQPTRTPLESEILEEDKVNHFLNDLHHATFGEGGWLKLERKRFPALSGHQSWQSREVNALKALDECDLQQAESQLKEIRSLIPNPVDPKKKRKRCGESASEATCLEFFLSEVKARISQLQKPGATTIQSIAPHNPFAELIEYPYSSTGDSELERKAKSKEKRSKILNKIINGLQEHIGGHAWGLYAALEARAARLSGFYDISNDRLADFAASATERLKDIGLQSIPDHIPTIHPPSHIELGSKRRVSDNLQTLGLGGFCKRVPTYRRYTGLSCVQQSTVPPHVSDYQSIAEARPQMSQDNRLPLPAGNSTVWRNKEENSTHQYGKPFRAYLGEHATRYYRGSHPIGSIQPKHQFTCPYHGPGKPGPQGQRVFTFSFGGVKPTMPFGDLVLLR
ncbi:hypothetical protein B0J15DRAFT_456909 [Fusarium solani]|uniref:Uncharacterized protein n=1 Tax=Fusarium solani TaxID=169388 RepID=A0A9P9RE28_FUSSL|nr:uncharacterized protein B0J15DRAFT_456909 [Fusarium solani]KAH7274690.1 hypothetical protein B0J15DRAFT_456909 [Fusarium solani]